MPTNCWERERNVLFNDTLNTFYLQLYGVRHMVKNNSDSERGNTLSPHGLLFPMSSKGSFICTIPRQDNTYHGLCYPSCGALAGRKNSSPWKIDLMTHRTMSERSYHGATSRSSSDREMGIWETVFTCLYPRRFRHACHGPRDRQSRSVASWQG